MCWYVDGYEGEYDDDKEDEEKEDDVVHTDAQITAAIEKASANGPDGMYRVCKWSLYLSLAPSSHVIASMPLSLSLTHTHTLFLSFPFQEATENESPKWHSRVLPVHPTPPRQPPHNKAVAHTPRLLREETRISIESDADPERWCRSRLSQRR